MLRLSGRAEARGRLLTVELPPSTGDSEAFRIYDLDNVKGTLRNSSTDMGRGNNCLSSSWKRLNHSMTNATAASPTPA